MSVDSDGLCLTSGALTPSLIQPPPTGGRNLAGGTGRSSSQIEWYTGLKQCRVQQGQAVQTQRSRMKWKVDSKDHLGAGFIKRYTTQVSKVGTEKVSRWRARSHVPWKPWRIGQCGAGGDGGCWWGGECRPLRTLSSHVVSTAPPVWPGLWRSRVHRSFTKRYQLAAGPGSIHT